MLWEGELPEMLVTGFYSGGNGMLVATNRRLIFLDKGLISFKMEDFSYDKITSIESKTGIVMGQLIIYGSGNKEEIKNVPKDMTRPFADFLRNKLATAKAEIEQPPKESPAPSSILEELRKLGELRDSGVLTDDEFTALKAKLL